MCGIAGFCGFTSDNRKQIRDMCGRIVHRGPDGEGYFMDEQTGVTLGHRRLAVVDLSENGAQPMTSASGRYVISFNGEVYNYRKLRERLLRDGHAAGFRGSSDTEVILEAFEAYGTEAVEDMKGMFAIALYDRRERTLYLIRDRAGEKPLYYGMVGGKFAFASELESLRALEGFDNAVSREALEAFIRYKSVPQPLSIYEHIYKLLPGYILRIQAPFQRPSFAAYWSLLETAENGRRKPFEGSCAEAAQELKRLLSEAVGQQLQADVPVGCFLSGGIDSPLVSAAAQSISPGRINTFTIGFEQKEFDEAQDAQRIADYLGTSHTQMYVTEKQMREIVPRLPEIFTEPLADPACLPTYLVSSLARSKVTVTLSGDGGDELFAGYDRYPESARSFGRLKKLPPAARSAGSALLQLSGRYGRWYAPAQYLRARSIGEFHELTRGGHSYGAYHAVPGVANPEDYLAGEVLRGDAYLLPDLADYKKNLLPRLRDDMECMLYRDQTGFLADTILNKVDRAGMAVSLENRIPLLDKDIIAFSWSLPMEYKYGGMGKRILKELLRQYVPKELLERPKHGFDVPLADWLRGPLREWAGELLTDSLLARENYLDSQIVHRLWADFLQKGTNALLVWNIVQAEGWYRARKASA